MKYAANAEGTPLYVVTTHGRLHHREELKPAANLKEAKTKYGFAILGWKKVRRATLADVERLVKS
jgi:hypothetical protein